MATKKKVVSKSKRTADKVQPATGELHVRIVNFSGEIEANTDVPVNIPALSSQVYLQRPLSDLGMPVGTDTSHVFVVAELVVEGKIASRNLLYLVPSKQITLPAAHITSELTQAADGYHLKLSSPVLARSVYVTFGDLNCELSDNYFNLLPDETADIVVKSGESLDKLKAALKVESLSDAFAPSEASR